MNVAPVLRLIGTTHKITNRAVAPMEAADAERDPESGRVVRAAVEARDGYDVIDLTMLTPDGGYAGVVMRAELVESCWRGVVPDRGQQMDLPVRGYISWQGNPGRRYPTVAFAVAGEVLAEEGATNHGLIPAGGTRSLASA